MWALARFPVVTTKLEERVAAIILLRETVERMSARTESGTAGRVNIVILAMMCLPGVSESVFLWLTCLGSTSAVARWNFAFLCPILV
jgi:hypothetical protein